MLKFSVLSVRDNCLAQRRKILWKQTSELEAAARRFAADRNTSRENVEIETRL